MKTTSYMGWAIDTRSKEGHNLLGRYWWFTDNPPTIPTHIEGHRVALFKTRALAREAVKRERAKSYVHWPDIKEVHVKVTIEQMRGKS